MSEAFVLALKSGPNGSKVDIINNMSVSSHGSEFRKLVSVVLKNLENSGVIFNLVENQRIGDQFLAPFFFKMGEFQCVVFCTTSVRSDRLKSNHWDSWGIGKVLDTEIKSFVVLPNNLSKREVEFADKEAMRIKKENYISMIDSIIFLANLPNFLKNYKNINK